MKLIIHSVLLISIATTGCQSFSTTVLNRLDDNSFQGSSNGLPKYFNQARPYKGIPITLQVPSHLDLYIEETCYSKIPPSGNKAVELLPDTRILNVRTDVIKTAKVFTVDFKRPGAGDLDLDLKFTEEQYFDQIKSKLEDKTIQETGKLVAQVITSVKAFSISASGPTADHVQLLELRGVRRETRVVAYQRFDINAVDFEFQVEEFVGKHLNCCNQCSTKPLYDEYSAEEVTF